MVKNRIKMEKKPIFVKLWKNVTKNVKNVKKEPQFFK